MYKLEEIEKFKEMSDKTTYGFENFPSERWIYLTMKKGAVAGNHYHKGLVKLKNPEINIVLNGSLEYSFEDLKTGQKETIIVDGPKIIRIEPDVHHVVTALEDTILLEPYNKENDDDKFTLE